MNFLFFQLARTSWELCGLVLAARNVIFAPWCWGQNLLLATPLMFKMLKHVKNYICWIHPSFQPCEFRDKEMMCRSFYLQRSLWLLAMSKQKPKIIVIRSTPEQTALLKATFSVSSNPSPSAITELSQRTGLYAHLFYVLRSLTRISPQTSEVDQ